MAESLEHEILYDNIIVYKNLFINYEKMMEHLEIRDNDPDNIAFYEKKQWYTFGDMFEGKTKDLSSLPDDKLDTYNEELAIYTEMVNANYKAIKHYVEFCNVKMDDPSKYYIAKGTVCKYNTKDKSNAPLGQDLVMVYHTDFQQEQKDKPGQKHFITCTTYLNDDYIGGEICFLIDGDHITYKPKAGDILVFPSNKPYYHGVSKTIQGKKYFVRNFMFYDFEGSPEWLDNQKRYGKELWEQMEKDRMESEVGVHHLDIFPDGITIGNIKTKREFGKIKKHVHYK